MSEGVHSTLTEKKRDGLIIIIIGGFNFTVIQINKTHSSLGQSFQSF